jgi:hypothetical protein
MTRSLLICEGGWVLCISSGAGRDNGLEFAKIQGFWLTGEALVNWRGGAGVLANWRREGAGVLVNSKAERQGL